MSLKSEILEKLIQRADSPQNEFDVIIKDNRTLLSELKEMDLSALLQIGRKADTLCRLIPYPKDELEAFMLNGELGVKSSAAELCNYLNAAENIFLK